MKSKMEYFNIFRPVYQTLSNVVALDIYRLLMLPECKYFLCTRLNLNDNDIVVIDVKPKLRKLKEIINQ